MKPIPFKEQNCTYAENQPEYLPLPAFKDDKGEVVSCWGMTWRERLRIIFSGKVYVSLLTFNHPLQPVALFAEAPFENVKDSQ